MDEKDLNDNVEVLETAQETEEQDPLVECQAEALKYKDQWMRAVAEMENVRKRSEKEREDTARYAVTSFARDLLSVADNLRRAIESVEGDDSSSSLATFKEGVELTEKELLNSFAKHGMKKIEPLGEKFDHNFHQAMFEVETADQAPGTVMQVMQSGYVIHDRLLRPAMVGVAKASKE